MHPFPLNLSPSELDFLKVSEVSRPKLVGSVYDGIYYAEGGSEK